MNLLGKYLVNNKINFSLGILFSVIKVALTIELALLVGVVLNFAMSDNLEQLQLIIILSISSLLLLAISIYLKQFFKNRFYFKALTNYKHNLYYKITFTDLVSFRHKNVSNYISMLTNDVNSIEINYLEQIFELPEQVLLLVGSLIAMIYSNWFFFLIILVASIFPLSSTLIYGRRMKYQEEQVSIKNENFVEAVKDMLSGFTVIKSFKVEHETLKLYDKANNNLEQIKLKRRNTIAVVETLSESSSLIIFIIIFIVGAVFTIKGYTELGIVAAFIQLINYIVGPIQKLPVIINKISASKVLIEKANIILDDKNNSSENRIKIDNFTDKVSFKNVSFSFDTNSILNNINVTFEKNKSYVIVGISGSGKSTLLNLIMGYYDNYIGNIKIDNLEIKEISGESLYDFISIIQQDVFIFDDDIISNITMNRNFTEEQINVAITKSGLLDFVNKKGVEYRCGENGNKLSGGEKQRVAIARCLLKGTPIILLDEATSALDNATSRQIEEEILAIDNTTKIVVAHKLQEEMLKKYDYIVTMKNGTVVEIGSFDELMNIKGMFYSIFNVSSSSDFIKK